MVSAARIYQGNTWLRTWRIKQKVNGVPVDLTGATARLHLRDESGALRIEASTENGRLTLDPRHGLIKLRVEASDMAGLSPGRYRYDLVVTYPDGRVKTYDPNTLSIVLGETR